MTNTKKPRPCVPANAFNAEPEIRVHRGEHVWDGPVLETRASRPIARRLVEAKRARGQKFDPSREHRRV